jgi:hypothetical protein
MRKQNPNIINTYAIPIARISRYKLCLTFFSSLKKMATDKKAAVLAALDDNVDPLQQDLTDELTAAADEVAINQIIGKVRLSLAICQNFKTV